MDTIVWRDEYSVGVVSLDEQHKTIVQLINRLIEHCEENVNSEIISDIFNEMTKYIKQHLEYEESLLKENNYPDLIEHVASHTKYIEEVLQSSNFFALEMIYEKCFLLDLQTFSYHKENLFYHLFDQDIHQC